METINKSRQSHEYTQDDIDELLEIWRANISDPPPPSGQFVTWLRTYGKRIASNAVNACVRKYRYMHSQQTPMEYDHALRYTSSCARNAKIAADTFHAPAEWLRNSE
ncbi:MAG TPA: hypothetical protein VGK01_11920 [Candidatus Angelobacter sp.]|jgi:hypothetical protein